MRYTDPFLQDRLAAEYVVGTLQGGARRRFQRLIITRPDLARRVVEWQERLYGLAKLLPQEEPPRHVWRGIHRRIDPRQQQDKPRRRLAALIAGVLGALGGAAVAAGLALAVFLPRLASDYEYSALLAGDASQPAWSLALDVDGPTLRARVIRAPRVEADRSLELWLMPPVAGDKPQSLGLLPRDGREQRPAELQRLTQRTPDTAPLAVSVEPQGGSPSGQPTGPVILTGRMVRL